MEMEELTREEAIRRHRLVWNWIADETEKIGTIVFGAAIGATIGVAVTIVYFENERR